MTEMTTQSSHASDLAVDVFIGLDVASIALLLDVDGTIVDIAPTPDAVQVSPELLNSLARLFETTGGALALVSGRPIADLDRLFAPLKLPAIGGHGAEIRLREDETIPLAALLPPAMRRQLAEACAFDRGIVHEDKGYSFTLHYRNAPGQKARLDRHIEKVRAAFPQEALEVQAGKAVFELKRPNVSKGKAVRELMAHPPFKGRRPVFIGDDETDKTLFAVLPEFGGVGFSVDLLYPGLAGIFASPADVRAALQVLAGRAARR
jgi:trehalose 6-phosphate phosphatase